MKWSPSQLKELLDEEAERYERFGFIESDPISIPHFFSKKEDIEVAAFLAATISWGNRKSIIANASKWMNWMDHQPHDFVLNHSKRELMRLKKFVHRTFNGDDAMFFVKGLQHLYLNHGGLEGSFSRHFKKGDIRTSIIGFREDFFEIPHPVRTTKHVSNPETGSSSKRINMFLRWMVRPGTKGVDFGLWNAIPTSALMLPLDVHTGNVARELGILQRNQNDWKALEEIMTTLRLFDKNDPVKYDFALFGMGVNNRFNATS